MPTTDSTRSEADGARYVTIDGERYYLGPAGLVKTADGHELGRALYISAETAWAALPIGACAGVLAMTRTRTGAIRALVTATEEHEAATDVNASNTAQGVAVGGAHGPE